MEGTMRESGIWWDVSRRFSSFVELKTFWTSSAVHGPWAERPLVNAVLTPRYLKLSLAGR
jgi:hypothetical protein